MTAIPEDIQKSRAIVNPMDLTGSTFLVTGGSSGIGQATAIRLSELGARVVVVGRSRTRLDQTVASLIGDGHLAEAYDLANVDDIPEWLQKLATGFGKLDGFVHAAGIAPSRPLRIVTVKALREILNINLEAAFMLARGFRRKEVCRDGGSLVFISSVAALRGQPGLSAYAATKGGLLSVTRNFATELASDKIRVNCIIPGFVETPMYQGYRELVDEDKIAQTQAAYPLGIGKPVDVANLIAFLLSDASRWITGTALTIDGGYLA